MISTIAQFDVGVLLCAPGSYIYEPEGRRIVEAHDPKEPLFIYMALQVMHAPQEVPTEFSDLYPQPKYDMDYAIM